MLIYTGGPTANAGAAEGEGGKLKGVMLSHDLLQASPGIFFKNFVL